MGKWSSFNDKVDLSALKTEAEEIKKNGGTGEIEETPAGLYRQKSLRFEKLKMVDLCLVLCSESSMLWMTRIMKRLRT